MTDRPYDPPVKRVDTSLSLRVAILLEMLEEVSRAEAPEQAVASYAARIRKIRPMDAFVGVSVRNLEPGQYKLTRLYRGEEIGGKGASTTNPWKEWASIPAHTGGFIGEAIARQEPQLIHNLDVRHDPALGDHLADMGSCLVVPLFDGGQILNWSFMLRRGAESYRLEDLEDNLLTGNLFGAMTKSLVVRGQLRATNERLQKQFQEVARVQQSLLPASLPDIPGIKFATSYLTSEEAGGDYYDFFELADGRLGILIADVSGHGPGAATVMAMLHAILHAYPQIQDGPASVLRFANKRLAAAKVEGGFVTAVFGVLDPKTRRFTVARAGHPLPRLKGADGHVSDINGVGALPMGIVEDGYDISECSVTLSKGQTVVLYTDGITESFDDQRRMFGIEGLDAALEKCSGDPDCVVDTVYKSLFAHTGKMTRDDDQTLVVFRIME